MIRLFIDKILFEHINLIVFKHASLSNFTQIFNLLSKSLIFINLFHKPSILLRLSGINCLWPSYTTKSNTSLSMQHTFIPSAHSFRIHVAHSEFGNIVKFNKIWISLYIILALNVVFSRRIKCCSYWVSICEGWRSAKLFSRSCILIELCHFFIT
jgi:hypothetical protein